MISPTPDERTQIAAVHKALMSSIQKGETIHLPAFDPGASAPGDFALQTVGVEPNDFGGYLGEFRYQFEGEDDLLHLMVLRRDGQPFPTEEARAIAAELLPGIAPGLVWVKPAPRSCHFYVGHDDLLAAF